MSDGCKRCGHVESSHQFCGDPCGCLATECGCVAFVRDDSGDPLNRIAVALESIAKSLDAMRRDAK